MVLALALCAGAGFGLLNVAVRWGVARGGSPGVGALVATVVAATVSTLVASPTLLAHRIDSSNVWLYLAVGVLAPGISQVLLTHAVTNAGSSRAAIVMGSSPLASVGLATHDPAKVVQRRRLDRELGCVLVVHPLPWVAAVDELHPN